jgi:hypothetical protein
VGGGWRGWEGVGGGGRGWEGMGGGGWGADGIYNSTEVFKEFLFLHFTLVRFKSSSKSRFSNTKKESGHSLYIFWGARLCMFATSFAYFTHF